MDPVKILSYLGKALQKKGKVRDEIIGEVNNLSSAILQACVFTSMRFNQALIKNEAVDKLDILVSMQNGEIEAHTRVNDMCGPVMHAAIELKNMFSDENLNVPTNKKNELQQLFDALIAGERGMQGFMEEYLDITSVLSMKSSTQIDNYLKAGIEKLKGLMKSAQECQFNISKLL